MRLPTVLRLLPPALIAAALAVPALASDVVVIGHKDNAHPLDKAQIARLFVGDLRTWPDGTPVVPLDQAEDNPLRGVFYTTVVGRSPAQAKAAWAQLTFSGKATPPKVVDSDAEVKKAVAANRNAIGYITPGSVDDTVKVLLK
jgi:ABC-type phosphate transport system substrate-binding protein